MVKDTEDENLFNTARTLLSDLRMSVATPADAMTVLCIALAILDLDYRKPGNTIEDCIEVVGSSLRQVEAAYAKSH